MDELDARGEDVRTLEAFFHQQGIQSVPAVILQSRHLVSGGQPVEVFESVLRQVASQKRGEG